jgi:hypothetical protein
MFANIVVTEDPAEELDEIFTAAFNNSTIAVCGSGFTNIYDCTYIVGGQVITSTLHLLSEFGLTGVLIDPLIVQVPADAVEVSATFDDGEGVRPAVTTVLDSFEFEPGRSITAEPGTKFLVLEFPPDVTSTLTETDPIHGAVISMELTFKQRKPHVPQQPPVTIKAMLAAKVIVRGHVYYAPTLPCVESFADVPEITIPVAENPVSLGPQLANFLMQGDAQPCSAKVYRYLAVPPPDSQTFLPMVQQ